MKHLILVVTVIIFLGTQNIFARGIPIPVGSVEHLKETFNLPNTDDYKSESGKYFDLGVKYEVFEIIWVPVWLTKDPIIVGLEEGNTDMYYDLTPEQINELLAANNLTEADVLKVSFWSKYTGLLIIIPILILVVLSYFIKDKDDEKQ